MEVAWTVFHEQQILEQHVINTITFIVSKLIFVLPHEK